MATSIIKGMNKPWTFKKTISRSATSSVTETISIAKSEYSEIFITGGTTSVILPNNFESAMPIHGYSGATGGFNYAWYGTVTVTDSAIEVTFRLDAKGSSVSSVSINVYVR